MCMVMKKKGKHRSQHYVGEQKVKKPERAEV
jgi:hypothetical protein